MSDGGQAGGSTPGPRRTLLVGVALTSGSILLLEIALTRYFSFRLWYHYAFMIISIAMLGLSASSSALAALRRRVPASSRPAVMTSGACLFAVTSLVALPALSGVSVLWSGVPNSGPIEGMAYVSLYWLVLFFPFFFGGCAISWAIDTYTARIGRVYGWDLAGGAAGCIAAVAVLSSRPPEQAISFAAGIAVAAAWCFSASEVLDARARQRLRAGLLVLGSSSIGLGLWGSVGNDPAITPTKGLAADLMRGGRLLATANGMTGRVDVIAPVAPIIWGLGRFDGPLPPQLLVRIDGDALTTITSRDRSYAGWAFAGYMPSTLPYAMGAPRNVLVIGPGGGMDVANALYHGVPHVTGVEINERVLDMLRGPFSVFSGRLYADPRVRVVHGDGRNFVERTPERFDLIQMTLVDTFAAISSGALSLAEDFLYTSEAFRAYVQSLSPDGYLVLGRTIHEGLPLTVLLEKATRGLGLDLSRHLFVTRNPGLEHGLVFLFKRSPLTREEIGHGLAFASRAGFETMYAPGLAAPAGEDIDRFLHAADRDAWIAAYGSDIRAESDDKPFYFRASKWSALLGTYTGGRGNLLVILCVSVVFALGFLILPIRRTLPEALGGHWPLLTVFGLIGIGYIVLELGLMVQLTLFLGHPTRSLTVTLFALLLASGLGSHLSRAVSSPGVPGSTRSLGRASWPFAGVALLAALYALMLRPVLMSLMGLELPWRIAIAVAFVAPIGILMGMPLPLTLSRLSSDQQDLVLWAWGINGTCSVIGSTLCIIVAHVSGYRSVILAAAACYLLGLGCLWLSGRRDPRPGIPAAP